MKMDIETVLKEIDSFIEKCVNSRIYYEENHCDSFNDCVHVLLDSDTVLSSFAGILKEWDLSDEERKAVLAKIERDLKFIDWTDEKGSAYGFPSHEDEKFIVGASWEIGEVEEQIEVSTLVEHLEDKFKVTFFDETVADLLADNVDKFTFCVRYRKGSSCFEAYGLTDTCLRAIIFEDQITEIIEDAIEYTLD